MRTMRVPGFVFATLAGLTLGACQLALGFGDKDFSNGTGGTSSTNHGPTTSTGSTGGHGGSGSSTGGHAGMASGTGGDGGPDADTGPVDTPGDGVWSVMFGAGGAGTAPTVKAMAVDANGYVYLTGAANGPLTGLGPCPVIKQDSAKGYLLKLDSKGNCVSAFLFGDGAEGTGVAVVDSNGQVALTGTFNGNMTIPMAAAADAGADAGATWTMISTSNTVDSFVAVLDSSNDYRAAWAVQIGENAMAPAPPAGAQSTTGVALNGSTLAVSGGYTSSLGLSFAGGSTTPITKKNDAQGDGFAIWLDQTTGAYLNDLTVIGTAASTGLGHSASGIAMDGMSRIWVTGTTAGPTTLPTGMPSPAPSLNGSMFLTGYDIPNQSPIGTVVVDTTTAQVGRSAALLGGDILVGGTFPANLALTATDGGVLAYPGNGGTSALIARYNTGGALVASLAFAPTTADTTIAGAVPDATGPNVFFAGSFSGTAAFQNLPSTQNLMSNTSAGTTAIYVAKADGMLGTLSWAKSFSDTGEMTLKSQSATAIAADPADGSVLIAGLFEGTLDFGGKTQKLPNKSGTPALFVAKLIP